MKNRFCTSIWNHFRWSQVQAISLCAHKSMPQSADRHCFYCCCQLSIYKLVTISKKSLFERRITERNRHRSRSAVHCKSSDLHFETDLYKGSVSRTVAIQRDTASTGWAWLGLAWPQWIYSLPLEINSVYKYLWLIASAGWST